MRNLPYADLGSPLDNLSDGIFWGEAFDPTNGTRTTSSDGPGTTDTANNSIDTFMAMFLSRDLSAEAPAPVDRQAAPATALLPPASVTTSVSSGGNKSSKLVGKKRTRRTNTVYDCPQCSSKMSNLRVLGDHIRDIHKMKGFKCDNCETRVARYDNLISHQRTCKPPPQRSTTSSTAMPDDTPLSRKRRPRVSVRDINLQPELIRCLPQPTQDTPPTEPRPTLALRGVGGMGPCPVPPSPTRIPQVNGVSSGSRGNKDNTTSNPMLEIEAMRIKLERLEFEVSHWKEQYFNLKCACTCTCNK